MGELPRRFAPRLKRARPVVDATTKVPASKNNFIRAWRLFRGIARQQDLADMTASINRSVLSRLESGSLHYHQRHLEELAPLLGCTPGDLIDTDPNKMGDVFRLYEQLSPDQRQRAFHAILDLTKAPPPSRKR